jgi:hypothetical protein
MKSTRLVLVLTLLLFLPSCAITNRTKAISDTFLSDVDVSKQLDNMHFNHSWVWTDVTHNQYQAVIVKPVRLDLLKPDGWKASISTLLRTKEAYEEKAQEIAKYFQEQLIEKINSYPERRYTVVDKADSGVAVIEIALTELEFSHPALQSTAIVVPVPGATQALASISDPHAAFALRFTDSKKGTLIATIADRKFPPIRLVDLNKATVSSSIREICSNWSKELASALNSGRFGEVERYGKIKLLPW